MGRRRKCRLVADLPVVTAFKPVGVPMGQLYGVALGLDGFEAMRLVDGEGLSQEEAARRMRVSRPTLCRILGEARTQVARALSRGWAIRIGVDGEHTVTGGGFGETAPCCQRARNCAKGRGQAKGEEICQDEQDREDEARVEADGVRVEADGVRAGEARAARAADAEEGVQAAEPEARAEPGRGASGATVPV